MSCFRIIFLFVFCRCWAQPIDVAIVGGGISGLYAAYRLSGEGSVAVFEASERLGGRILTVDIAGERAEMGAMRFFDFHQNIFRLASEELRIPLESADGLSKVHFHWLRGQKVMIEDYHLHPEKVPYLLDESEKGKTPYELFISCFEAKIPGVSQCASLPELQKLLRNCEINHKPLYECSLWEVVGSALSEEGGNLIRDAYGFKAHFEDTVNAYDQILAIFLSSQNFTNKFIRPVDGMGSIVQALKLAVAERGVSLLTNHTLQGVYLCEEEEEPYFALVMGEEIIYARQVILAISPTAIFALNGDSILFSDPEVTELLKKSKTSIPAQKLFFVYDTPWWKNLGFSEGRYHTTAESQQVYFWRGPLLLAQYSDVPALRGGECFISREEIPSEVVAPAALVKARISELESVYGPLPVPHTALYRDWSPLPIGGAFHRWNTGVKSWEVIPKIMKPYPSLPLYIAGDHYASGTGWIEIALNNMEMLLINHFGLKRASWIQDDYELSP